MLLTASLALFPRGLLGLMPISKGVFVGSSLSPRVIRLSAITVVDRYLERRPISFT